MSRRRLIRPPSGDPGNLTIAGDSVSAGYPFGLEFAWPIYAMSEIRGRATLNNRAISGMSIGGPSGFLAARALGSGNGYVDDTIQSVGRFRASDTAKNVLVLFAGHNDMHGLDPSTGEELIADANTFITDSLALGWGQPNGRIVVVTIFRRPDGLPGYEAGRLLYNDWLRDLADDVTIFCADVCDHPQFDSPSDDSFADGLHLAIIGAQRLGPLIAVDINRAIGAV